MFNTFLRTYQLKSHQRGVVRIFINRPTTTIEKTRKNGRQPEDSNKTGRLAKPEDSSKTGRCARQAIWVESIIFYIL